MQSYTQAHVSKTLNKWCYYSDIQCDFIFAAKRKNFIDFLEFVFFFILRKQKMDLPQTDFVLADERNGKGILTLNQPKMLNALHFEMAEKIYVALNKWQNTKSMIIIKGNGGRAFCAGGDLKRLIDRNQYEIGVNFFRVEYTTYFLIANLRIPWISLIDGIIMGSGVGCSIHGKYRIATERTVFAMPETLIGAVPDIGSSYFLPRLQGYLGYYLGLTGSRLHGKENLVYCLTKTPL